MKTSDAFRLAFLTHPNACSDRSCSSAAAGRSDWVKRSIKVAEAQGVSKCASIDDSPAQMLVSSPDAADNAFRGAFQSVESVKSARVSVSLHFLVLQFCTTEFFKMKFNSRKENF